MQISAQVPKTYSTNGLAGVIGRACGDQRAAQHPSGPPCLHRASRILHTFLNIVLYTTHPHTIRIEYLNISTIAIHLGGKVSKTIRESLGGSFLIGCENLSSGWKDSPQTPKN